MASALSISTVTTPAPPAPPAPRGVVWIDVGTAAKRSGLDERHIRRLCAAEWFSKGLARQLAGKGKWEVREDADVRLSRIRFADDMPADLKGLTHVNQKLVLAKAAIVRSYEAYTGAAEQRGQSRELATARFLNELAAGTLIDAKLSHGLQVPTDRTLRRWRSAYRKDGIAGLIDERGTRQAKPTADDPFFKHVESLWLDDRKWKIKVCWEHACKESQISGWMSRSYKQTQRHIARIPHAIAVLKRYGKKVFDGTVSPHVTRDYSTVKSNEIWCTDHHQFDCWVSHRGKLVRPWLTAFEDIRSRKIVGWFITPGSGNTDTVLEALHKGVTSHGLPDRIYADNGKEFDSAAMQGQTKQMRFGKIQVDPGVMAGVLGGLKIAMTHAIAFNAKAKPVERCFGTVCGRFSKLQSTYCGNKPENRPPSLKGKLERGCAPELADFIAAFELWLEGDYHSRPHTGDSMDGRTPNAVFETYLESKRTAPVEILEVMLWKPSRPTKATKDGVRFGGIGYGNREPALIQRLGKEVIVRVDRNHAGRAAICETDGRFICFAPSNIRLPFNTKPEELREHLAEIKRGNKQIREAYRSRPRPVHDVAASIYEARAEEDRKAREAANIAPPTLVPANTPMSGQLPALQRELAAVQTEPDRTADRRHSMLDRLASIFDAEREQDRIAKEAARDAWDALKKKVWPDEAEAG